MKTYSAKPSEVERKWYLMDASSAALGRLSTEIAGYLTGKGKPMYTQHIDCGDYVVVVNSDKLKVTGDKKLKKTYYRHTGYPGGIKEANLQTMIDKDSTKVIHQAVKGMLPVNKLRAERLKRLKVYAGEQHDHTAQNPTPIKPKGDK
ncbi:MAG TPA: 50S ribosomal protein L13 [Candidatus Saccharimonadales bacterium]|nr:50S ribosomal protein L13 [Candidatus Saccharimonadales bacterium]